MSSLELRVNVIVRPNLITLKFPSQLLGVLLVIYGYAEILMLGTGATIPTTERFLPGILVRDKMGNVIMLDAGEGAQLRLGQAGISPLAIDLIAITHDHGDHVNGLPGLLQSMYVGGRSRKLVLLAPASIAWYASEALEAREDRLGFKVEIVTLRNRGSLEIARSSGDILTIYWFPVCHTVEAYGFKLEWRLRPRIDVRKIETIGLKPGPWVRDLLEKGEVEMGGSKIRIEDLLERGEIRLALSYTGDTAPCPEYIRDIEGSRILLHDSTFHSELGEEANLKGHSTAAQAASKALEARVELLVLTHISSRYRGPDSRKLLEEARSIYRNTVMARDLMRLAIGTVNPPVINV